MQRIEQLTDVFEDEHFESIDRDYFGILLK